MIDKKKYILKALVSMIIFYVITTPVCILLFYTIGDVPVKQITRLMIAGSLFYMNGLWLGYLYACGSVDKEAKV